jgi:hypothetical protein
LHSFEQSVVITPSYAGGLRRNVKDAVWPDALRKKSSKSKNCQKKIVPSRPTHILSNLIKNFFRKKVLRCTYANKVPKNKIAQE